MIKRINGNAVIQWPLVDADGHLYLSKGWRMDECLVFHPDGQIESNGGPVGHHEITEEEVELLFQDEQTFVRNFLQG